jgi:hypothetical protein
MFMDINWGELNITEFTIWHRWFMTLYRMNSKHYRVHHLTSIVHEYLSHMGSLLGSFVSILPCSRVVMYEFWRVFKDQCFRQTTHPILRLADFEFRFQHLFLEIFPLHWFTYKFSRMHGGWRTVGWALSDSWSHYF